MKDSNYYDVTLKLDRIKHLFQEPKFDPFAVRQDYSSGLEQIISKLKPKSLTCKLRTTILLSEDGLSDNIEQLTIEAVRRYCSARIEQITQDLASLRGQGIRTLRRGLLFLAVCLLLSSLFDGLEYFPGSLRRFLSEGFLIAGWVSLWHPIQLLLYEWGPYWRQRQIYQLIRDMELKVTAKN
jgi:hypothetical protein